MMPPDFSGLRTLFYVGGIAIVVLLLAVIGLTLTLVLR